MKYRRDFCWAIATITGKASKLIGRQKSMIVLLKTFRIKGDQTRKICRGEAHLSLSALLALNSTDKI